ncbi:hypothetical protein NSK_006694 [Nannochloropsis salina CCMP1776]|jgi:tetratricopeptide (TPR) repeat protein|uniref:RNA-polymerase II-associated protein 3-like C-terminal domain-containing protein n=1 Tax=Nannochloropsis salina CCMP1776 TaxID=1027361 RepID=A0A4D9CT57_9STRA|nr:hypothetical protein NSK_006694 [Nannochloropsis salina CCMP1776]|eukprot:TFJ82026.1 hypothetical protein NSK_006694 [Nannochloropsis salina CCMP1776]
MDLVSELFLAGHEDEKPPMRITPALLDANFIQSCDDPKVLRGILRRLKSGKDGLSADLEREVKDRLWLFSPAQVRAKVTTLRAQTPPEEIADEEARLEKWTAEICQKDKALLATAGESSIGGELVDLDRPNSDRLTPVRPMRTVTASRSRVMGAREGTNDRAPTIVSSKSMQEALASKVEDGNEDEEEVRAAESLLAATRQTCDSPPAQRMVMAASLKEEGNAFFKRGEYAKALASYTKSLGFNALDPAVCGNRALVYMRLGEWVKAEVDCTLAIARDPSYAKAWLRRGTIRRQRGKRAEARKDLEEVLRWGAGSMEGKVAREALSLLHRMDEEGRACSQDGKDAVQGLRDETSAPASTPSSSVPSGPRDREGSASKPEKSYPEATPRPVPLADISNETCSMEMPCLEADFPPPLAEGFRRVPVVEEEAGRPSSTRALSTASPQAPREVSLPHRTLHPRASFTQETSGERRRPSNDTLVQTNVSSEDASGGGNAPVKGKRSRSGGPLRETLASKEMGNEALARGDLARAIQYYSEGIEQDAGHLPLYNNRCLAYLRQGRWEEAKTDASRVLESEPENIKARYRRGKAACRAAESRVARVEEVLESTAGAGESLKGDRDPTVPLEAAEKALTAALEDLDWILERDKKNTEAQKEQGVARLLLSKLQSMRQPSTLPAARKQSSKTNKFLNSSVSDVAPCDGSVGALIKENLAQEPEDVLLAQRTGLEASHGARTGGKKGGKTKDGSWFVREVSTQPRQSPAEPVRRVSVVEESCGSRDPVSCSTGALQPTDRPFPPAVDVLKVPPPPKTVTMLETHWRTLKRKGDVAYLAAYLRGFNPKTFPRVFKRVTDQDVVNDVFSVTAQVFCQGKDKGDAKIVCKVLEGMACVESFEMMRLLMSDVDKENIKTAFRFLEEGSSSLLNVQASGRNNRDMKDAEKVLEDLRRKYFP